MEGWETSRRNFGIGTVFLSGLLPGSLSVDVPAAGATGVGVGVRGNSCCRLSDEQKKGKKGKSQEWEIKSPIRRRAH